MQFTIAFEKLANYSVFAVVAAYVFGYVISTQYLGRFGAGNAEVPVYCILSAGISFIVVTSFFWAIGYQSRFISSPFQAVALLGALFSAVIFVAFFLIFRFGLLTYVSLCVVVGFFVSYSELVSVKSTEITINRPLNIVPILLMWLYLYSLMVYPNLSRALGGAAPKPIKLTLSNSELARLFHADERLYEILLTSNTLFLAVEPKSTISPGISRFSELSSRTHPFIIKTRFLQIPRTSILAMEYTDDWLSPEALPGGQ